MSTTSPVDVIVVGAGISGLCAAKYLVERGHRVVVLEARDRVGGRTLTKTDPKVGYVDLGGSYVGPTQDRILRVAKELGVKNYLVNEEEDIVYLKNGKRWRFKNDAFPGFWNVFAYLDLNNLFRKIDEMGQMIPTKNPWDCPKAEEWDTMTVKEFLDRTCWTQTAKDYGKMLMSLFVTTSTYEGSLLWFLWYIRQCGGIMRIMSTTNGGQERKFVGGSQQISIGLARKLEDRVVLSSPVSKIVQTGDDVTVHTLSGKSYKGKFAILAMAPTMQAKIHYTPPLPALRNQLVQRCPMGSVMKCILYYDRPFWRDLGFCGNCLFHCDFDNPITATFDDTKPDGSIPAIIGFNVADSVRSNTEFTPEERKNRFARSLAKAFGSNEALKVIHYEEKNWMEEQYSGGCYTPMLPPGFLTRYGRKLREPFGRLHFAGTETAAHWSGYMEGAVEAGERAAREILHRMGEIQKSEIWEEEPPSQDVPAREFPVLFRNHLPSVPGLIKLAVVGVLIGLVYRSRLSRDDLVHGTVRYCQQMFLKPSGA